MTPPTSTPLTAALVSTDPEFRETLSSALRQQGVEVRLEIRVAFTEIADDHLEDLREADPALVFLDLASEPHVGVKFAQFLSDSGLGRGMVGAGPADSPDLLLSAMQAGISEYLPRPVTDEALRAALERVRRKSGRSGEEESRDPARLLPVFGAKGGSGSTTVSANLAIEIHRLTRARTLLLDLDLELGETALLLGVEPRFSVVDLMRNFHRVDSGLLASYIERHETGVELLSAPYQPADFEAVSADRIRHVLAFLRQHYDYIVIDCPKTFNPASTTALEEAEELYLVATADLPALRNLTRCLPLLRDLGRRKPDSWMRPVVNRYDPSDLITLDEVEKTLGMEVYGTLRNDYRAVMSSINAGEPVVMDTRSAFARDVRRLAASITGVQLSEPSGGWLTGLLSPFRDGRSDTSDRKKVSHG